MTDENQTPNNSDNQDNQDNPDNLNNTQDTQEQGPTSAQTNTDGQWEIDNLPNRLTLFRILLIPVIFVSLSLLMLDWKVVEKWSSFLGYLAGWTFVAASITDFLDGYIARKRKIETVFGSFLDPIADKFLVVTSLILLQALYRIPAYLVIILVLREIYITALRLLAMERGFKVPVGKLGKWKTAFQMIGIPMLMAYEYPFGIPFPELGIGFIYLAAGASLYSSLQYTLNLIKKMKQKRIETKSLKP
ncbi:MAG: CDP-diacylglycerol--glycerol-3-phosphate 3-phosphatidyltransferase [Bacteriovoracaceae bacterium]